MSEEMIYTRNEEAGFVEFLNDDVATIVREIDNPCAILLDMDTRKVVGYRVYDPIRASSGVEVEVKGLEWEHLGADSWRAPAPFFGSFRVEHYGSGYVALWSVPGFTDTFVHGHWETADGAKQSIEAAVRRILSCLSSPLPTVEVTEEMARLFIKRYREIWPGAGWPALSDAIDLLTAALSQNKADTPFGHEYGDGVKLSTVVEALSQNKGEE